MEEEPVLSVRMFMPQRHRKSLPAMKAQNRDSAGGAAKVTQDI
jgi:hypothetical protein